MVAEVKHIQGDADAPKGVRRANLRQPVADDDEDGAHRQAVLLGQAGRRHEHAEGDLPRVVSSSGSAGAWLALELDEDDGVNPVDATAQDEVGRPPDALFEVQRGERPAHRDPGEAKQLPGSAGDGGSAKPRSAGAFGPSGAAGRAAVREPDPHVRVQNVAASSARGPASAWGAGGLGTIGRAPAVRRDARGQRGGRGSGRVAGHRGLGLTYSRSW